MPFLGTHLQVGHREHNVWINFCKPVTPWLKPCKLSQAARPLRLRQIRCISVQGGLLGTWVKYKQNYFYLCPFWERTYRLDTATDIHAWWLKRRGLAQGCAFLGIFHIAPHLGGQKPQKHFGAWIGVFKPNTWNRKTCILSKLLHRFQPNFAQW